MLFDYIRLTSHNPCSIDIKYNISYGSKNRLYKNPLTIIAIFAGIAEVSGTAILPFISPENQQLFIFYLIGFPTILVILFFITLNFNNKVLYAPSDYKDESNYIKLNMFDIKKQTNVEVIKNVESELEGRIQLLEYSINSFTQRPQKGNTPQQVNKGAYKVLVTNFPDANLFLDQLKQKGYSGEIYHSPDNINLVQDYDSNKAIWLGSTIPLDDAKEIIKTARKVFPHLDYIHLSKWKESFYIGGTTSTAVEKYNTSPLHISDFDKIQEMKTIEDLHDFINSFKR